MSVPTPALNFLDGIQVRLTEKYRAPRRVTLPLEYTNCLQQDIEAILDLDYDFKLEEEIIATYPSNRESPHPQESAKRPADEDPAKNAARLKSNVNNVNNEIPGQDARVKPARPPPLNPLNPSTTLNPLLASVSFSPLKPQKVTQQTVGIPSTPSSIQVDEFEPTAANPFDNLELKSLNDMEELQLVLNHPRVQDKDIPDSK